MHVTLQLRNLSGSTTEDDLESLFAQVGDVMDVRIVRDRGNGVSRGFGFLTMSAQSEADKAVSRFNHRTLHGLALVVSLARPRVVSSTTGLPF